MRTFYCDYKRMAKDLQIPESKAIEYMGRFIDDPYANVTTGEMRNFIETLVSDGVVVRPVRKVGRPITIKPGFDGIRVSKTIKMDTTVSHIVDKYLDTHTASGFIEDAIIFYDRILKLGYTSESIVAMFGEVSGDKGNI